MFKMNFNVKMDDKKLKVDIESTNLKGYFDILQAKKKVVLTKVGLIEKNDHYKEYEKNTIWLEKGLDK